MDVDDNGKMDPEHLEKLIKEDIENGFYPFFVNCTAGTTVIGAFDPINPIADICEKYNTWLHIDVKNSFLISKSFYFNLTIIRQRGVGVY